MHIDITDDAARFLPDVESFLRRDALRHTVITTSLRNQIDGRFAGTRFLAVRDGADAVVGLAQCTADGRAYLGDLPRSSVALVADALATDAAPLRTVEGAAGEVNSFVERWSARGGTHCENSRTRLLRLGSLRAPTVRGAPRRAVEGDIDLCLAWVHAFDVEVGFSRRLDEAVARRLIEAGLWWLWDVDGAPSAFAARQTAAFGWARIGPVYTPPPLRGHGYASALTAAVAQVIRGAGADVCLFTDSANSTSNKIYREIGFEPVGEFVCHTLRAG